VSEDAGRGLGQRVWGGVLVIPGLDPAHHAEATYIVDIDGFEPEEAEVCEINPVATVLVASEVPLADRSKVIFWHRLGVADGCRSR
jgi:hypothetical protein